MPYSESAINLVYRRVLRAAMLRKRAPFSNSKGIPYQISSELIRRGKIKVEVYGRNWRVIEITAGRFAGLRTLAPPQAGQPYRVLP